MLLLASPFPQVEIWDVAPWPWTRQVWRKISCGSSYWMAINPVIGMKKHRITVSMVLTMAYYIWHLQPFVFQWLFDIPSEHFKLCSLFACCKFFGFGLCLRIGYSKILRFIILFPIQMATRECPHFQSNAIARETNTQQKRTELIEKAMGRTCSAISELCRQECWNDNEHAMACHIIIRRNRVLPSSLQGGLSGKLT